MHSHTSPEFCNRTRQQEAQSERGSKHLRRVRRRDTFDVESNDNSGILHQEQKALTTSLILRLAYESMGVVYGDLGTSPLYVYSSTFPKGLNSVNYKNDVLGALSLIIYTLTLVPLVKYVFIVLMANDHGDGGTFALYSLICRYAKVSLLPNEQVEDRQLSAYKLKLPCRELKLASEVKRRLEQSHFAKTMLLIITLLGTSMVIGDGIFTPAISVLSAVSGIDQATPSLNQSSVVIISVVILITLFMLQRLGTSKVGFMFAPAVITWYISIGSIGLYNIVEHDLSVFKAFYPKYIYDYFKINRKQGWVSLGGIVLAITGTEAMFADLGHFSVPSIQMAFSFLVYPCLVLAYIGQAAYLSKNPRHVDNTFYKSIPKPVYWPMFIIAVAASIIASQAMISATFTVVKQSMSLGCFPRFKVVHTSSKVAGQVYIPEMNWILMIACVAVTATFKTAVKLGNAYGIAVVGVMVATTFLVTLVMIMIWQTNIFLAVAFWVVFGFVDLVYFSSVLYKFDQGGYLPLAFAAVLLFIMYVWHDVTTRRYIYETEHTVSLDALSLLVSNTFRVPGIGFVYTELAQGIPGIFSHMVGNLPAIHSVVVFVTVKFLPVTSVLEDERFHIRRIGATSLHMYRCVARYGYRQVREEAHGFEEQLLMKLIGCVTLDLETAKQCCTDLDLERREVPIHVAESEQDGNNQRQEIESMSSSSSNNKLASHEGQFTESSTEQCRSTDELEQELSRLNAGRDAGVVYMLDHSDVYATMQSSFVKRFIVNHVYNFLRRNCREDREYLMVPNQKLLKVGMVYYL